MNNIKEEVKGFWNKNKSKIIFGAKCLGVGFGIGFVKGYITNDKDSNKDIFYQITNRLDNLTSKLPEYDPELFLRTIKNDDLLLNELRRRYYNEIDICREDVGKGVVDIMEDVLDNHWRAEGYEY